MKIGVMNGTIYSLPNFPVTLFSDVAVAAEQLGFDGYFVNDHFNLRARAEGFLQMFPSIMVDMFLLKRKTCNIHQFPILFSPLCKT